MNNETKYTKEQHELIADLCTTYGIEPDQIVFFTGDPAPFFDRDATAVLIHKLTNAVGIEDDIVPSTLGDSVMVKYRITFADGSFASSTGTANVHETDADGKPLSFEQLQSLATSRASRSALKNKGINLLKLHNLRKSGNVSPIEFSGPPQTERQRLLREVHALGQETGLIWTSTSSDKETEFDEKGSWRRVLNVRYQVNSSKELNEDLLRDFAAFLRSQLPAKAA